MMIEGCFHGRAHFNSEKSVGASLRGRRGVPGTLFIGAFNLTPVHTTLHISVLTSAGIITKWMVGYWLQYFIQGRSWLIMYVDDWLLLSQVLSGNFCPSLNRLLNFIERFKGSPQVFQDRIIKIPLHSWYVLSWCIFLAKKLKWI